METIERKPCPYCAEPIAVAAAKCRFCGEWLNGNDEAQSLVAEVEDARAAETYEGPGASEGRSGRLFKKEPWTLRPGERVVSRSKPYIERFVIVMLVLGIPTVGITAVIGGVTWLSYRLKRIEWILTDRRLVLVEGWLSRRAHSVSLDKVNEISYGRSFLDRVLFSTGAIVVESAATAGRTSLKPAAEDDPFRHALETQVELRRRSVSARVA